MVVLGLKVISLFLFISCSRLYHCMLWCTKFNFIFQYYGMWQCVLGLINTDVSNKHRIVIFSVKSIFFNYLIQKFKGLRSFEWSRNSRPRNSVVFHDANNFSNIVVRNSDFRSFCWALGKFHTISWHFIVELRGTKAELLLSNARHKINKMHKIIL
jgi:hypothetical protein